MVLALAILPLTASPTQAATPITACGTTASAGRYLVTDDLTCAGGENGIVVAGSNVTIDLGGHTITGPGRSTGSGEKGVNILPGSRYVKVGNGTIRTFEWGVVVADTQNLTLSGLRLFDPLYDGIYLNRSNAVGIDGITFDGDSAGTDNTLAQGGIECTACADATITRSDLRDADKLVVFAESTRLKVSTTTVTHANRQGVFLLNTDASLGYVTARGSGSTGIRIDCNDSSNQGQMLSLTNSTAIDNGSDGFELDDCGSMLLKPVVKGNRAESNLGDGFDVDDLYYATYDGNLSVSNGDRGFYIQSARPGPSVKSNTANDNGSDGFFAEGNTGLSALADGSANVALRNGGHGFYADAAVPGTGNYAAGNAVEPQCLAWVSKRK